MCIWDVLFPVVNFIKLHVTSISVVTERGLPKTPTKGQRAGGDNVNTQRKSEDEVRNENWCLSMRIVLKEICGLFKTSTAKKHINSLNRFTEAWKQLCEYLKACATDIPAQDVGECTIESTVILLTVVATDLGFDRDFWALTLDTLADIVVTVAGRSPNKKTSQIFTNMVHTLGEMISGNTQSVQPEDVMRIIDIIAPLPVLPIDDELDEKDGTTALHREVLAFCTGLQKLPQSVCSEDVTKKVILLLAQYPQQALLARYQKQGEAPSDREQRRWTGVLAFGASAVTLAAEMFNAETTPADVRADTLQGFTKAIEDALLTRHREAPPAIQKGICNAWAHLFTALVGIVDSGAEAVKEGGMQECWSGVIETSADLIFFDKKTPNPVVAGSVGEGGVDTAEKCRLCADLIDRTTKALIKYGESYPGIGTELVKALFAGAKLAATAMPDLCRDCYHGAFALAMNGASRDDLIRETSPLIISQSKDVMERFSISKDKECNALHTEVICILRELKELRTTVADPPKAAGSSPHGFLLMLFNVLCELTSSQEKDVKTAVKDLLDIIGNEFLGI